MGLDTGVKISNIQTMAGFEQLAGLDRCCNDTGFHSPATRQ